MSKQRGKVCGQRTWLTLCALMIVSVIGFAGFGKTAQAQIVLDENAAEEPITPPSADTVIAATHGAAITQLRTFSGKVDYTVIGNSFTSSETSCDNLGSRSASLSVPAGSTIKAAYLYWAGSGSSVDTVVAFNGQTIAAQKSWQDSFINGSSTMYFFGARAEVTHLVSGSNNYTVSGLSYHNGAPYCNTYSTLGNWALVVVYENNSLPDQIVNLYDGFQGEFRGPNGTSNSTTLTHYLPVNIPGGCAQAVQLTHVSHEGDNYKGEYLYINNSSFGNNTYNGSTAPNLDIDSYNITNLVGTGASNISFATQNYYTNGAQEAYFNNAFVIKYRSCVAPTPTNTPVPPTPTNTTVPPTPTNTPVPPTPTNTTVPPTATPTNTTAPQLGSIGNKIWRDENGNGILDNNEPGVANVTVQLKDCSGNLLGTRTTDVNGFYGFNNLAAGCYVVGVVLPSGFSYSPLDQGGNDSIDSDINPATGMTAPINLGPGQTLFTIDAGLIPATQPTPTPTNTPVGPTPTPTNTPAGPTPTPTPQVGGPVCYDGPCPDTDNDGIPDYLDEDDDNDGIPSVDEDANGNGFLEDDDSDNDGIPDYLDPRDSDNDTVPDPTEDVNRNGNLNDDDTDHDGTPNYLDTDSDNDGISDKREVGSVPSFPYDADGDGTPDYLDADSDNDGKSDAAEGVSSDDGDGIPDYLDPQDDGPGSGDSDNDGVPDAVECPPALLGSTLPDVDRDGIPDYLDTDPVNRFYMPLIGRQ